MADIQNGKPEDVPLQPIDQSEPEPSKEDEKEDEKVHDAVAKARWKKAIDFVMTQVRLGEGALASSESEEKLDEALVEDDDDDQTDQQSLHDLACDRHIAILEEVLKSDDDIQINLCDRAGRTALQCAVERQSVKAVELLLQYGANPSVTIPGSDDRLLHQAVRTGNVDIVRLMLDKLKDSDINVSGNEGYKPIHSAIMTKNNVIDVELLDSGADINALNTHQTTPLLLATEKADLSTMRMLISYKPPFRSTTKYKVYRGRTLVNVNHRDLEAKTALMFAASQGNIQKIALLIRYGASLTSVDIHGQTILHKAVGNLSTLDVLMQYPDAKKLLERRDKSGNTVLHLAAEEYLDNVEFLLNQGAKQHVRNKMGRTPLHLAVKNGRLDIAQTLLDSLPGEDDKISLAHGGVSPRTKLLNTEDKKGRTALHIAASLDHSDIVRELQDRGAYVTSTHDGHYPIHLACNRGCINAVKLLLERDNQWLAWPDNDGNTPLHHAAWKGHVALVTFLLQAGTPILENNKGANCLDLALKTGQEGVCMAIAKHDKWHQCLRKSDRGQLRDMVIGMPRVASRFMDNFKRPDTDSDKEAYLYDFGYFKKDDNLSHRLSSPLQAMMDFGNCIDHEIVVKFLDIAWSRFGFLMYVVMLIFYMLYLGSICALVWLDGPLRKTKNGTLVDTKKDETDLGTFGLQSTLALVVLISCCIEILTIVSKIVIDPRSYLGFIMLMDCVKCLATMIYIVPYFHIAIEENFERSAGAIAIFFSWICLILCLQSLPVFGIYVILIKNHVWTIVKVCPIFILPLFAFGFAYFTVLSAQIPFKTLVKSVLTSWVMMLGEMDYEARILEAAEGIQGALIFLFIAFCIVAIVVMNLLVALAVGDMQEVMESAAKERLLVQMQLFLGLEQHILIKGLLFVMRRDANSIFPAKYVEVIEEKKTLLTFMQSVVENVLGGEDDDKDTGGGEGGASTEDIQFVKDKLEDQGKQLQEIHKILKAFVGDESIGTDSKRASLAL